MSPSAPVQRVILKELPFLEAERERGWIERGFWRASWITHASQPAAPCRIAFRCVVEIAAATEVRLHVAGDERYELYIDGARAGWGSERGTLERWYFDSYDWSASPGRHVVTAVVQAHGVLGLRSQLSLQPGFLLAAETVNGAGTGERNESIALDTGKAPWQARVLPPLGYEKPFPGEFFSVGWNTVLRGGAHNAGAPGDEGEWTAAVALHPGSSAGIRTRHPRMHLLTPATLPVAAETPHAGGWVRHVSAVTRGPVDSANDAPAEHAAWQRWLAGDSPLTVPPHTARRVIVDLRDYACVLPELAVSAGAGASVRIHFAESLFEGAESPHKGDRAAVQGKWFVGVGDRFEPDGSKGCAFRPPFIRTGRYVEICVATQSQELVLESLELNSAEYPLPVTGRVATRLPQVNAVLAACRKTVLASSHDAIIDGPFYEQMSWIGDVPQVALALYTMSPDARLVRKALADFDASRLPCGLIRAQWPSRNSVVLPLYSLHWIGIAHDYMMWRRDRAFVAAIVPGMRAILDYWLAELGPNDGLARAPFGWRFADWVRGWNGGEPPTGPEGASALFHWILAWTLRRAAQMEQYAGEPEPAARWLRRATELVAAAEVFWDEQRGLYSDTTERTLFSEHTQAAALLAGGLPPGRAARLAAALADAGARARAGAEAERKLTPATVSFCHYVLEALATAGGFRDAIWQRIQPWLDYTANGMLTVPEQPEPTRSDCHGWSSHPHYHLVRSLLGLRPGSPGFATVEFRPAPLPMPHVEVALPHPDGEILLELSTEGDRFEGFIRLPAGVTGELWLPTSPAPTALGAGETRFRSQ
ncbi:hypothetical protein DB346_00480 [Verrucomicrobia bacterium LW23]|nr:hypothetical protein DB346_00480 [Verrucomicrobia bacterium LW23]